MSLARRHCAWHAYHRHCSSPCSQSTSWHRRAWPITRRVTGSTWSRSVHFSSVRLSLFALNTALTDQRRSSLSRSERPPFSITRFDDRYAEAKFSKSRVWDKVPEESTLFWRYSNFLLTQVEVRSRAKNQLDSFSSFDRTPACDRRWDRETDRHRAIASSALAYRRAGKTGCETSPDESVRAQGWTAGSANERD